MENAHVFQIPCLFYVCWFSVQKFKPSLWRHHFLRHNQAPAGQRQTLSNCFHRLSLYIKSSLLRLDLDLYAEQTNFLVSIRPIRHLSLIYSIITCWLSTHVCMQLCSLCVPVMATFPVMVAWAAAPVLAPASSPSVDTAARPGWTAVASALS